MMMQRRLLLLFFPPPESIVGEYILKAVSLYAGMWVMTCVCASVDQVLG